VSFQVHFTGQSFSKTATVERGAAPVIVGRDPSADVHLPDNDRLISRKHLVIEWTEGGPQFEILSKVNGLITTRGEVTFGNKVVLAAGESAQVGRFFVAVDRAPVAMPPVMPRSPAPSAPREPDPFDLLMGGSHAGPNASVFDDPFFKPAKAAPATAMADPAAAMQAMSGRPAQVGFSGTAAPADLDPLAALSGASQAGSPAAHGSIDDFLAGASPQGGLGAASLLKPAAQPQQARLATDHVHDFNLPVRAVSVRAVPPPPPAAAPAPAAKAPASDDPWGEFAQEWVQADAPPAPAPEPAPAPAPARSYAPATASPISSPLDDPFSSSTSWRADDLDAHGDAFSAFAADSGVHSFADAPPRPPAPPAGTSGTGGTLQRVSTSEDGKALRGLCRGLGLPVPQQLTEKDWEQLGDSIRLIIKGMSELMSTRAEMKKELRAVDRTMLGAQENNPLKSGMPLEDLLQYLLFMPQGGAGYMPVQRALEESIGDLRAHEFASLAAIRTAVEGSIKEFEPGKMRTTLLKGKRSIASVVDNARLWDLYTTHYESRAEHMADWLEQVFNRHFMPAYSRESERLRREAKGKG
jgi:type VI secretion system FHA domain protein